MKNLRCEHILRQILVVHKICFKALPDNSNGQESLNTGRFLWQSNNDEVDETIFSGRCAQLNGVPCSTCLDSPDMHRYRFAYPYIPNCGGDCDYDVCGNRLKDAVGDMLSRGYLAPGYNYYSQPHGSDGQFFGREDFPLSIIAWSSVGHHASRLPIFAS